jgi:uncharacterized protein YbjT (DUF2867 family)
VPLLTLIQGINTVETRLQYQIKMKIIVTGATGMVGEGVLIECLENNAVSEVLMLNRRPFDMKHKKLKELIVPDFTKTESVEQQLIGYDGCFFCAGISSVGISEEKYRYITYDTTINFATTLSRLNPSMVFTYVSGGGTDSSEKGRLNWARVKGKTENDLMKLPFKGVYNFRPGVMKHFPQQKNVKALYKPFIALASILVPKHMLTLKQVGQAMINAVNKGYEKHVLEIRDIRDLAARN